VVRRQPKTPITRQTIKITSTSDEKSHVSPLMYTSAKKTDRHSKLFIVTAPYISENVKDADLSFFLLANMIADTASAELVARGNAMKEMKKEGMLVAVEKLSTASTNGSAKAAAIAVPSSSNNTALIEGVGDFSAP